MFEINAMGEACPRPVIMAKNALKEYSAVTIEVDNFIATQNLAKMAQQLNYTIDTMTLTPTHYKVTIRHAGDTTQVEPKEAKVEVSNAVRSDDYVVVISSDTMGSGDEELSRLLMKGFLFALASEDVLPQQIIFYNSGVKLLAENSESLEDIRQLEKQGVSIFGCGLCVDFYKLNDQLGVGNITNMAMILETMRTANRIVTP